MEIERCLFEILTRNVGAAHNVRPRWIGFRGELDLLPVLQKRENISKILSGGIFLPARKGAAPLDNPVYFTVVPSSVDLSSYVPVFKAVSNVGCNAMFLVVYDKSSAFESWALEDVMGVGFKVPVPRFEVYEFDPEKGFGKCGSGINALVSRYRKTGRRKTGPVMEWESFTDRHFLEGFDPSAVLALYVERLVFDGYLGFGVERGIPADIDVVIQNNIGEYYLLEVKEKDLSKRPPRGFGMDNRRIASLARMQELTGCPYWYIVRQIDNQKSRDLVGWHTISLKNFEKQTRGSRSIEGGTGMRHSGSSNKTQVCPVEYFSGF